MNNTIFYDAKISDDARRKLLFDGQIFVYSPMPSSAAFIKFARSMIEDAFGGRDPRKAQENMSVEVYADLLGKLKPAFIHHPESKRHIQNMFDEMGIDRNKTYFDVPRMRSSTSGGYLTTGIAYAWHAHRDTWYSAPQCQINWWMPIYDIESNNAMAFHPRYWTKPVKNSSSGYNYYKWNKEHRGANVAKLTKEDNRPLPRATEPMELDPQYRIICPPGGIILFSAAHMHSSVPNTSGVTRFSVDFRVVHVDDALAKVGAPNIDSACTGTVMRDFLNGMTLTRMPDEVVALYDDDTATEGELVYAPKQPVAQEQ
jgi:hypothetical protein